MIAVGVLLLQILACLGLGDAALRILGIEKFLTFAERVLWAAAMGIGFIGWILFILGVSVGFSNTWLLGLLIVSALFAIPIIRELKLTKNLFGHPWSGMEILLLVGFLIVVLFDYFEALSPPADADTLAYHFAIPKQFINSGRIEFVPRAVDGAIPLLFQTTYIPPLSLGGELALTLWTMVSGWLASGLIYVLCRRYFDRVWSMAVALLLLTTPAVVYGGGSGQIEIRNAVFVIITAVSIAESIATGRLRFALLAGLAAGFFVGAKYTGLIFALAGGLTILAQQRWFASGIIFTAAMLVSGSQWYIWNYIHTGDPIFPMLYGVVDYVDESYWDSAHNITLQHMWASEKSLAINAFNYLMYPFVATISDLKALESSRTGFGPAALLMVPFALAAVWQFRHILKTSKLTPIAVVVFIFYTIWFFTGPSQRVRHLLPVFPLLILCVTAAAHKWAGSHGYLTTLSAALAISIFIQLGGFSLFSANYAHYILSRETKKSFLLRNVSQYKPVPWINRNLRGSDRIFVTARQLIYHLNVPVYYGHFFNDARVNIGPSGTDPQQLFRQLKNQEISHVLLIGLAGSSPGLAWKHLIRNGCLKSVRKFKISNIRSRTLLYHKIIGNQESNAEVHKLIANCQNS